MELVPCPKTFTQTVGVKIKPVTRHEAQPPKTGEAELNTNKKGFLTSKSIFILI